MTTLEFEFKIPLKRDDLRSNESANEYVVSEIYNLKDLEIKIEECKLRAGEIGCDFILEYFPTVFSILHHFNTLDFKILCSFYEDVILKESEGLFNSLSVILADDDIDPELRNKMLNITKMLLYATIEFMKCFQEKIDKIYSLVINEKRKKNTKLMKLKEEHNWDWEANERKALIIINKVVKLPLQRLWDPPTPEEEFVRMIDDCCYNVLEKPSVTSANMKPTRDLIFEILGILIKHYNNAISCKVKIVQLLKLYEHLVVILAQAVIFLVEKYNCRSLIKELILEIIETEEETDTYTQDGSSSRQFSNFIVEIAKLRPQLVLPYINLLINNLSSDPYSMRICVLTVMAEIIINVLQPQGASLSEENIKLRNSFLDHLLDHIYDNNTFVRSRALKLWQSLYKEKSVPTSYIIPLLKRATDRLNDKSSNVVKNSIQLITSMLEENLYGPTLETSAVKQNLRAVKLQLIEAENAKSEPSVFKIWYYSRTDISDFVFKQLKDDEEEGIFDSDNGQSSNDVSLVQKSDVDLSETLSQLQKQVIAQDIEKIFKTLIEFENEHIGKSNFLKSVNDKVQYYEWILGHICKNNTNVREDIIARFASCEDSEDIKNIVDESIQLEDESDSEFGSEKKILTYCEDFLRFVETTSEATAVIREILIRKSAVEVLEAVEFFKVAHQFNLAGADEGVRSMLLLINSKEPGFKDAVKNAFKVLYLQNENSNEYESAVEAVNKLIVLLKKVTHEQKQALANLIKEWVLNKDLGPDFILVLWEKYTRKLPNTSYEDSTAAAVLISMYASGKPEVIKTNMDMLIKYGLGVNQNNYAFLKQTISMFNALFGIKNEGVSTRYPPDAEIFEKLLYIVHEQFTNLRNGLYPEIAMEAISVIYRLSKNPDTTVGRILKLIHKNLIDEQVENTRVFNCQEELLARFVTVLSHAVFCHWQYLETDVLNELKRRHAKTNAKNKKEKKTAMNKSNSKSMIQKSLAENTTTTDSFEDDTQALASEQIAESVRMVCEKELLYGETLFAKFSLMILSICKQPEKYTNTRLKSAASLALSKLMMVSSVFCSENIQLFVTLMEKSNDVDVRNNLVLAFGDLTFRFPNITDVWTGYFYNRLKDESTNVRYTALVVISHLITNEMIKVRSQMSDVALCLVDSDKLVQNHALHLFYELSLKGNTLYNVMADIISRLSHPDHRPDEKTFQTIMKVLMKLITKDRHLEAIVEKLCHRIRGASDERQCIDLSYCLTLISYSEKTFQKLLDNIICYADKLNYARVHRNFTTVIINCKKLKTGKISEAALELDQKISIILSKGMDNLDADFLKPPKTPMKTPHRGNSSMFKTPASTRKSRLRSAKKVIDFDSDDEE